jgi:hypothetical protein
MPDESTADFMHDQLEALMASPTLARVAERHGDGSHEPDDFDESVEERDTERDTEPNFDVQMLREALRLGLKE